MKLEKPKKLVVVLLASIVSTVFLSGFKTPAINDKTIDLNLNNQFIYVVNSVHGEKSNVSCNNCHGDKNNYKSSKSIINIQNIGTKTLFFPSQFKPNT